MGRLGEPQPSPSLECLRERCLPGPRKPLEDDEGQAGGSGKSHLFTYLRKGEKELEVSDERVDEEGEVAEAQVRDSRHAVLHFDHRALPRLREGLLSGLVNVAPDLSPYPGNYHGLRNPLPLFLKLADRYLEAPSNLALEVQVANMCS